MWKEIIICVVIVVAVIVGNWVTQNYTKESVEQLSKELSELKHELLKESDEEINNDTVKEKADKIREDWEKRHDKLAYYIEHNELEKVEEDLTSTKSFIETKEYSEAINDLDECVFMLKHIQEKYAFSLENVF